MSELIHQFISIQSQRNPEAKALKHKDLEFSYAELEQCVADAGEGLLRLGLEPGDRVATWLPKIPEMVFTVFGTSRAAGVFVPVNPLLKPAQVAYILQDCNVRVLVTSGQRLTQLAPFYLRARTWNPLWWSKTRCRNWKHPRNGRCAGTN